MSTQTYLEGQGGLGVGLFTVVDLKSSLRSWWIARLAGLYAVLILLVLQQLFQSASFSNEQLYFGYGILGLAFLFNLLHALNDNRIVGSRLLISINLGFDCLVTASWIYFTGGQETLYLLFYLVQILLVALIFYQKAAIATAAFASALYGTVLFINGTSSGDALLSWGSYSGLFLILGFVGGYLSEEVLRTSLSLKEKQERIERLKALHDLILSNMATGLLAVDGKMNIQFINTAGAQILGEDEENLQGKPLSKVKPELMKFFSQLDEEHVPDPSPTSLNIESEVSATQENGQRSYLMNAKFDEGSARLQQIVTIETQESEQILRGDVAKFAWEFSDEELAGKILLFQDVTKLVHLEEKLHQNEKLAAVGQLAAGIAHEIRNPLASMSASIEMLKSTISPAALGAENGKLMGIVVKEIDRLNDLISEFLDYVKPAKFVTEPIDLKSLIGELVFTASQHKDFSDRVTLVEKYNDGAVAAANPQKLKQVIWNLVVNALQAFDEPGHLELGCENIDSEWVKFWVQDEGRGMSEDVQRRLFEPFFTTKEKGTGLGLAAAYRIIEVHGGEISVESKPGEGTRFEVKLPRAMKKAKSS